MADAAGAAGLLGTLYIRLTAQVSDLSKNMDDAEKKVTASSNKMDKAAQLLKSTLGALGLAFGLSKVVGFIKETINGADEMKKFSEELDIGIDKLAGFKFAADKANVGEQFEMGMRLFAKSLREAQVQGSDMQAIFQKLNINPMQGVEKGFEQVIDKFGKMENGINKVGLAQEIFGTRNARFINLLSQGTEGLNKDTEELARVMGVSYTEAAEKANQFNDSLTTLKAAFTGLAITFINEALPAIIEFNQNFAGEIGKWKEAATLIGTVVVGAVKGLVMVFQGLIGAIKVTGIAELGLLEILLKTSRWIAEKGSVAFEFWANAGIKAINFLISGINAMSNKLPQWIKNRLGIGNGAAVEPLELFKLGKPTGLDDWIDKVHFTRKGLQDQLAVDFGATAEVIKKGNKEVKEALKQGPGGKGGGKEEAINSEAFKASKKRVEDFMQQSGGDLPGGGRKGLGEMGSIKMDIAGLSDMGGFSEATKMQQDKELISQNLNDIQKIREEAAKSGFDLTVAHNKRLTEMEALYAEKRKAIKVAEARLQLQTASTMFGDLADITGAFAGKQSGVYKTMFAISKAFAIADATVKIAQGIAAAAANPWPLNLFAMASVVAATASIVSSIQAVQLEFGGKKALGGPVSSGKAFLVGEQGPEMFVPSGRGEIIPNNRLGGGPTKIVVNNYTDAQPQITERMEGDEKVVELLIRRVKGEISSDIREGRGTITKAMESSFKLRRGQ
jgi:hypothetical protein